MGRMPLDSHDLLVVIKIAAILTSEGWLYLNQTKATILNGSFIFRPSIFMGIWWVFRVVTVGSLKIAGTERCLLTFSFLRFCRVFST